MTKIKICGIKTLPDALAAINAGADYLGFNFYTKGIRFIEKESPKHYGSGLGITVPEMSFKPNTTAEDKLGLNIPEKIKNSNATNISQLFHDANNDKDNILSFFKKPEQVTPNVGKRQLYENLSYNPKTEAII